MTIRNFSHYTPKLDSTSYVDPDAVVIGNVSMGQNSSTWPMSVIRGDVNSITIGDNTNIQDNSVLHVTHAQASTPNGYPLIIGNEVTVGHSVTLHGCVIHDRCLIGIGAIVLDGALIKSETLIAAGSLVPPGKILESGFLWLGNPVKKIRPLIQEELNYFSYSAAHYVKLKQQHEETTKC